jgi:hypothetical protein
MSESEQERIQRLLRSAFPPIADAEPTRDLWPEMLRRIEAADSRVRFGLLDWVIAGLVAASVFFFPGLIPGLLYHL